jgi:hypothetical protein
MEQSSSHVSILGRPVSAQGNSGLFFFPGICLNQIKLIQIL